MGVGRGFAFRIDSVGSLGFWLRILVPVIVAGLRNDAVREVGVSAFHPIVHDGDHYTFAVATRFPDGKHIRIGTRCALRLSGVFESPLPREERVIWLDLGCEVSPKDDVCPKDLGVLSETGGQSKAGGFAGMEDHETRVECHRLNRDGSDLRGQSADVGTGCDLGGHAAGDDAATAVRSRFASGINHGFESGSRGP